MKHKYKQALMDMSERFGQTSAAERLKVGCLIYKNESIISLGVNGQPPGLDYERCEDINGDTEPTVRHAEIAAFEKLWNSAETSTGAEIFISHQPCLACSIKIATAKISKVYYRHPYRCDKGIDYLISVGIPVERVQ